MKVCMISPTFPHMRCGVGDFTSCLSEFLTSRDLQLSIITSRDDRIRPNTKSANKTKIFRTVNRWGLPSLPLILRKIASLRPDIVHIQYETHMYSRKSMINFLPLVAKLTGFSCTFIVTLHEFEGPYLFSSKGALGGMGLKELVRFLLSGGPLKDCKLRALLTWSDSIIVTNETHLRHLKKEFPDQKSKFRRIPLGTPLYLAPNPRFDQLAFRREKGLTDSTILLSYFGFLRRDKKLELLLQAIRELSDREYKVKLLVLTSIGDVVETEDTYLEELQILTRELNLQDKVIWKDYLPPQEVVDYLSCSDICVLPYESGVSERRTSFISAISLGLPVITSTGPEGDSVSPDFKDGINIRLIFPNDLDQLCAAIIELVESKPLREHLSEEAKKLSQRFSWDQIVDETMSVYGERCQN